MGFGIRLEVWGDYALFTRPEMKVERVSYDVMTPSAARGIIEAIYWKPAIRWVIDRIYVMNPILFTNIRRNEVASKISGSNLSQVMNGGQKPLFLDVTADRQQRAALLLKDVHYVIEAHFELTEKAGADDTAEKHYNIILRRIRKGQFFHQPSFGCREFPAHFQLYEEETAPAAIPEDKDLGYMLYDFDYRDKDNIVPIFFRAALEQGVLHLQQVEMVR